jgi:hypothetical protein
MQDNSQIQWDPMYEYRLPWESRFLVLYLLFVVAVSVARSVPLLRQLWWFSVSRRRSLQKSDSENDRADLLAAAALANRFASDPEASPSGRQLQLAESRFMYTWEMCSATVRSMKRLAVLTFLLSIALPAMQAAETLRRAWESKIIGTAAFAAGMSEVLMPFALGVFVCAALYAPCSLYEGMLARRRASWNYFCARVRSKQPTE